MLFADILEMWWIGEKLNLREITLYKRRMMIDTHILPYFGDLKITDIDDITINKFISNEREHGNRTTGQGICTNSIIKEIEVMRSIMKYAEEKDS